MLKRLWKWVRKTDAEKLGIAECTKDFIGDDNEYINAENGWEKLPDEFIEVEVKENGKADSGKTH